jgi:transcriptional regulator
MMFIPEPFKPKSSILNLLAKLISESPFASLISSMEDREIYISKVPIILHDEKIYGHLSSRNDHCRHIKNSKAVHRLLIDGPHGFISPRFLGNRPNDIPTWNYVSSVIDANITPIEDKAGIRQTLARQLQIYDAQNTAYLDPGEFAIIEQEIMAFSVPLTEENVLLKVKLSQNKSDADFQAIIEHLKNAGQQDLVDWMLRERNSTN